jgi:putative tryptophan/tyrosine transport system substrate-binding protein
MASHIGRREFLATLGGAAAAWPIAARAQQPSPVGPLIGLLSPLSAMAASRNVAAFRSALRDLGYVEGRNLTLALRYGDGNAERMPSLARELVALNPDVILTGAISGASAAYNATRRIPIVTITQDDPVTAGLAQSLARPGGNVTGTWNFGGAKGLDFFKLALPHLRHVGAMFNPDDPEDALQIQELLTVAREVGVTIEVLENRDLRNLDTAASHLRASNVQGLFFGIAPFWLSARTDIVTMVAGLKLPAVYGWREFADAGGLMSYGANLPDLYRQSARLVDAILKGTKPGDLPFERPTRYELVVNLKTAKAMGLNISDPFLLLADEVIE